MNTHSKFYHEQMLLRFKGVQKLVDNPEECPKLIGICSMVTMGLGSDEDPLTYVDRELARNYMMDVFAKWPEYTGRPCHPVPSTHPAYDPKEAYVMLDPWEGEYGAARRRLLAFMIEYTENRIREL